MEPCVSCRTCRRGGPQNKLTLRPIHLGNFRLNEQGEPIELAESQEMFFAKKIKWNVDDIWKTTTYKGVQITCRVATAADVDELTKTPNVFPLPDSNGESFWPQQLVEYTDFRGLSFPYICIAVLDGKIVGRLYLDPNSNNAIRRNLDAAVIDSIVVDAQHEGRGIADKLIEFAESIAQKNGVSWLEIGVVRDTSDTDPSHRRKGTDSARSYIRRGFYKYPLYLKNKFELHYQARGLPKGIATFVSRRYGKALVMYKDLEQTTELDDDRRVRLFNKLVAGIPAVPLKNTKKFLKVR